MTNIPKETETLIADLLREIILTPKDFSVRAVEMSNSFTIYIQSNFPDHKRLIGSMRKHFLATTQIVKRIAAKNDWQAEVAPIEFTGPAYFDKYPEFVAREDWPRERILDLVLRLGRACFDYGSDVELNTVDGPGGSTNIDMFVSEAEDRMNVAEMLTCFRTLIRPIGKNNGRTLYFNIVPNIPNEQQPATADGRHMKTLNR